MSPGAERAMATPGPCLMAFTALVVFMAGLGSAGCDVAGDEPNVSLERMIEQPRYDPYESTEVFADRSAMRHPPPGTVPRERLLGPRAVVYGEEGGEPAGGVPVAEIPVPVDPGTLRDGRERFRIYCATCHSRAGDGDSPVARNMTLRPPPSLVDEPVRSAPPGHLFRVATRGYGVMPGYADVLTVEERWAVVAYVEVLQLASRVELERLPEPLRAEAGRRLEGAPEPAGGRSPFAGSTDSPGAEPARPGRPDDAPQEPPESPPEPPP